MDGGKAVSFSWTFDVGTIIRWDTGIGTLKFDLTSISLEGIWAHEPG